jgi:hypothetical protein
MNASKTLVKPIGRRNGESLGEVFIQGLGVGGLEEGVVGSAKRF